MEYRNCGLGVIGYGTMLFKLGIKYGSEEAKELTDHIFTCMFRVAVFASNKLAKEKVCFPKYKKLIWDSKIIQDHFTPDEIEQLKIDGLRNCSLLSIAPGGSIGTMLLVTTGIEPEFAITYKRKTESLDNGKEKYYEIKCNALNGYQKINNTNDIPDYFKSSADIYWKNRVDIQAIIQNHIDTAISSTVNLPNSITIDDVEQLYLYAWEQGCKGITIYRSGCKKEGVLTTESKQNSDSFLPWSNVPAPV
jgi:ribonucleoside-diphosphate reductase alpha chain